MNSADRLFTSLEENGWAENSAGTGVESDTESEALLPRELVRLLRKDAEHLWQVEEFHPAQIGRGQEKSLHSEIRSDAIYWLDSKPQSSQTGEGVTGFLDWADSFRRLLNERYYLGLNSSEFHFARYPEGNGYRKHLDQSRDSHHDQYTAPHRPGQERKVSFVLYLNPSWSEGDGGELVLYSAKDSEIVAKKIQPTFGRLVVFRSDLIAHEVLPCFQTRWSLTGWFRTEVQSHS